MADGEVTRGEFELVKQMLATTEARLTQMDNQGTRGVVALQTQVIELIKDFTEMKSDFTKRLNDHDLKHEQEARDRKSSRRWLIGIGITAVGVLSGIGTLLYYIVTSLPGH